MKASEVETGWDAVHYQLELMNPFFTVYQFGTDPTVENLAKAAYIPMVLGATGAVMYGATVSAVKPGLLHAMGSTMSWGRQGVNRASMWMLRQGGMAAVRSSPVVVPAAIAAAGAYTYEKKVNEPLRKEHSGFTSWFGPYASGFGTVV
jgi:hypothetical protein